MVRHHNFVFCSAVCRVGEVSSARPHLWLHSIMLHWVVLMMVAECPIGNAVGIKRRLAERMAKQGGDGDPEGDVQAESGGASSSGQGEPRGGIRRRLRDHVPASEQPGGPECRSGPLFKKLVKKWAMGKMSSAEIQQMAEAAQGQGAKGMERLASMGASGEHPQNCFRAMKRMLGIPSGAPSMTFIDIPTIHGEATAHPFLLPHEFFAEYFKSNAERFASTISGSTDAALQFWRSMAQTDFVKKHLALPMTSWGKTIPIGMHGDGASFSHQDSVYAFSWNSLIGVGYTVQKRFVATVISKKNMVEGTMDAIMRVLSWSCNIMLSGRTPEKDWLGRALKNGGAPLAGGWRGALCQVRGDWAYYCELFRFPQWNSANRMCWLCKASSTTAARAWTQFGDDAGWRRSRWTHEAYVQFLRACGFAIPALLLLATGFRLEGIMIDVLHTVDQGVASHLIANVMWLFAVVRNVFGCATQEEKVQKLYEHMDGWFQGRKASKRFQGKLTVQRIRTKGGWPKLKSKSCCDQAAGCLCDAPDTTVRDSCRSQGAWPVQADGAVLRHSGIRIAVPDAHCQSRAADPRQAFRWLVCIPGE